MDTTSTGGARVTGGSGAARTPGGPRAPFVGREREAAALVDALTRRPALVVVAGESGIGKSRLVREGVASPELCRHVVTGSCRWARVPVPLGPVVEGLRHQRAALAGLRLPAVTGALRPWLPELADVLPDDGVAPHDPDAVRHRLLRAAREVLAALGDVVLVLEDVDRADVLTLELLAYLVSDPPSGLGIVLTFRDDAPHAPLTGAVAQARGLHRATVRLGALSVDGTRRLVTAMTGAELIADDVALRLHERTGGVPLVVEELVGALTERGLLVGEEGALSLRAGPQSVPDGVRDAVLARVQGLPETARRVVDVAAVLHRPSSVEVLAACAGTTADAALEPLEEALRAGVLVEHGGDLGFRHPLAAEAVHEAIPRWRREPLHARAAEVLERHGAEPVRVARHRWHAGEREAWAAATERAADDAAARGDDAEAARLLADLLRHGDLADGRRVALAVRLGRAAIAAIHTVPDVLDLLEPATALAAGTDRGELHLSIALLRTQVERDPAARRQHFERAVDDLGERPDLRARAMVALGDPTYPDRRPEEPRRWLHGSLDVLPAVPGARDRVFLRGKAAMVLVTMGDPVWRGLVDEMLRATGGVAAGRREASGFESVAADAAFSGHHEAARRLLAAVPAATAATDAGTGLRVRRTSALLDFCTGRWDGLDERLVELARNAGAYPSVRVVTDALRGGLALSRGDLVRAERLLERAVGVREAVDLRPLAVTSLLRLLVARGRHDAAFALGRRVLDEARGAGLWAPVVRVLPSWVEAATSPREVEEASDVVDRLALDVAGLDVPLATAAQRHATGLRERAEREWDSAAVTLLGAASAYDDHSCVHEAALAREAAAGCLLESGDPQASALLTEPLAVFRVLGATWDEGRAARTARVAGLAAPARHRGGRRGYGDALSPREREVAVLAAAGRTDREIARELHLSPRTVEKHLAAARRKLGAATRSGLAHLLGPG